MKLRIFLMLFLLSACGESGVEIPPSFLCEKHPKSFLDYDWSRCLSEQHLYEQKCDTKLQSKFIIDCAKAANPMSDEEGEDLVAECRKTAYSLYCGRVYKND